MMVSPRLPLWWKFWLIGTDSDCAAAAACLESMLSAHPVHERSLVRKDDDRLEAFDSVAQSLQVNQCFEANIHPPIDEESVRTKLAERFPRVAVVLAHQSHALFQNNYLTRTTRVWLWRPSAMPMWPMHSFFIGVGFNGITQISMDTPSVSFGDVVHQEEIRIPDQQVAEALLKLEPVCRILRTYLRALHRSENLCATLPQPSLDEVQGGRL